MKPLEGKTALITGAAAPNGIGRATASRLAADGANVIISDREGTLEVGGSPLSTLQLLEEAAEAIRDAGGNVLALELDVTREDHLERAIDEATGTFGNIDILVNNAGTTVGTGPFLDASPAQWQTSFEVNLLAPARLSQLVIPVMKQAGGGIIINVGSTGSLGAEAGFGAYTAMKHGIIGLTKTIAAEFGVDGIRCNAVCPGYIMTDMHAGANARIAEETGRPIEEVKESRYANVALRRAGEPAEVAATIAFLVSPAAAYITGVALPVHGGVPAGL